MTAHARSRSRCGSPCNDHRSCDCECDDDTERHAIRDEFLDCVETSGDIDIEATDGVVSVSAKTAGVVPNANLPCPGDLECPHHVTVIAVDTNVNITNLGTDGTGTATVFAGTARTFWIADRKNACSFWVLGE